jgi:hypothetical protein
MVPWNKCLISTVVFALAMAPVAGGGQAKTAAAPGAAAGAKPGPEPCANEVVAATSQVGSTATEMGKTADAVGTAGEKITKAFNSWKTPKPPAKPATTTTTAAAAKPAAVPAAATTAANAAGAAGAAGGGGSAPCAPAKKELASSGPGGGGPTDKEVKPGPATNTAPNAPLVIDTPPTFTAMPDGDIMLGYVAPGTSATTYAKVKLLPAATPPPATSPHDGTYTDSKMFYTVSGGKMFVMPIGGATVAAPGAPAVAAVAAKPAPVSGLVADVSGTTLIINIGTNAGVKVGTKLDVVRPRVIKDPTTHKDLKTVDTSLGSLTITGADAMTATGMYTGTAPTKVGDTVKTPE